MAAGRRFGAALCLAGLLLLPGCGHNMAQQPRTNPLASSAFFEDGQGACAPVAGTVARGELHLDERLFAGKVGGAFVGNIPMTVDRSLFERGRERFGIFCSPCHGKAGDGGGMIVERGLRRPASYHVDRLREAPDGYLFDVITNGFGAMPSYASRVEARDRWAIVAWVRVLQLSQAARLEDLPGAERARLLGKEK